jgi:hypothetical protein
MSDRPYDPSDPLVDDVTGDVEDPSLSGGDPDHNNADLMNADTDPLPDAQVPGAGPDGQA